MKYLKRNLSEEEMNKIDIEADAKLDELIESKITREEILGIERYGVPLNANPFFNLIRNDIKMRRKQFSSDQEYSVNWIVNLAIYQNVEVDKAASGSGRMVLD